MSELSHTAHARRDCQNLPEGPRLHALADSPSRRLRFVQNCSPSWSLPQLHALGYVRANPGASLSELAGYLGIGLPTASTLVSRLVTAGYLHREEDPAERRRVVLSLTDGGRGRFDGALELARRELAERLGRLSQRDLAKVTAAVTQLRRIFDVGAGAPR